MHPFFHIQPDLIQRLDDAQARKLIARLCEADIARAGLAPCVFHGGDQRAADDGVDVEVSGRPAKDLSERLSRSVAIVQVKAETKPFGPTRIKKEMAPGDKLRPAIAALASDRGLYLIASTKENPSFKVRTARTAAMREVLANNGLDAKIRVDFYGAQEIASWVETHPTVGIWLRQILGQPLTGWQGYGPWAYRETDTEREFTLDQAGRVLVPEHTELVPLTDALAAIRADLRSGGAVRLVGLSGLGKTRLAQALFDDRLKVHEPALSQNAVLYADIGDRLSPTPEEMIEALPAGAGETFMIVDNCGQETHNALVEKQKKSLASVGLLTIEYDIQDRIAPSTRAYKLDGASDDTMDTILRERFPRLSGPDRDVIIGASHGNARLAFAIAETAEQSGQLSSLEDGELFRRLFHQKAETGNELLRCARAASLVYSFNGEDMEAGSELCILAGLAEVSPDTFYWHMAEIKRRGLLQARGKMRAILPHALSNYLAKEALEENSLAKIRAALFTNAPPRVKASFGHRLSYLPNSVEAVEIVSSWLSPGGALSKISDMRDEEMLIFKRIASLRPELTLSAIERFLDEAEFGSRLQYELRSLASIVSSIAYDPGLFASAVQALIRISAIDLRDSNGRSKTLDSITSLFQVIYSGTHATAQQRGALLRELLSSSDERLWRLGIECLDAALNALSLSSSGSIRFGSRKRDYGRAPQSMEEQREWFTEFLSIAGEWAPNQDQRGALVRATIGKRARDLLHLDDGTINALIQLAPSFQTEDGWPQAWTAVKLLLKRKNLDKEFRQRAKAFEQAVAPRGLRQRVVAKLHSRELFDDDDTDVDTHEQREEEARRETSDVGAELGANDALLYEMLPQIMKPGVRGLTFALGKGVAASHPNVPYLLETIGTQLATVEQQPVSLLFVCGLMSAWAESAPDEATRFLDAAVCDPVWARWFSDLQRVVPFDAQAIRRVLAAIDHGVAPVEEFNWLGWGKTLTPHPVAELTLLFDRLAEVGLKGIRVALDNLHMQVYNAKDLSASEQSKLGAYCLRFLLDYDWSELDLEQSMEEHELDLVLGCAARHSPNFESLAGLLDKCIAFRKKNMRYTRPAQGHLITSVVQRFPEESLDYLMTHPAFKNLGEVANLLLMEAPIDDSGHGRQLISDDTLLSWVAKDPIGRTGLAAHICRLEAPDAEGEVLNKEKANAIFRRLYDLAPSKVEAVAALGSRLVQNSYSSSDVPHMAAGIRMLESLPVAHSEEETEIRNRLKSELANRIEWMSDLRSSRRTEPEGFE